jgi:periplasmic copper chaperone A
MKEASMFRPILAAAAALSLLAPAAAQAHVTLQPDTAPAGGFTRLDVRVPNERDDAGTTKVDVQLPPGFETASYEPVPGWDVEVAREGEQVTQITWTGEGKQGVIAPGQFQDFGLSLKMPEGKGGEKLIFKALQTYDDGEVVRWIGPEDADEPAPVVTLEAAAGGHAAAAGSSAPAPAASSDDGGTDTLTIVAVVLGALALIAALGALAAARRTSAKSGREEVAARV